MKNKQKISMQFFFIKLIVLRFFSLKSHMNDCLYTSLPPFNLIQHSFSVSHQGKIHIFSRLIYIQTYAICRKENPGRLHRGHHGVRLHHWVHRRQAPLVRSPEEPIGSHWRQSVMFGGCFSINTQRRWSNDDPLAIVKTFFISILSTVGAVGAWPPVAVRPQAGRCRRTTAAASGWWGTRTSASLWAVQATKYG